MFQIALMTVLTMLLYALPGYLTVKTKLLDDKSIPVLAKLLLYVCQPFQSVYVFQKVTFSASLMKEIGITFILTLVFMCVMLGAVFLALRKTQINVPTRIYTIASVFGNCVFMGVPFLEALLPDYPQATIFASVSFVAMSILTWTIGSAIIAHDIKYMKPKKILLNPATLSFFVALVLFVFNIRIPSPFDDMVTLMGKMCTPLCMLMLGMRYARIPAVRPFTGLKMYAVSLVKLVLFPLTALLVLKLLPLSTEYSRTIYILCCMPVANIVLSFAEILGKGQDVAANSVILSTFLSLATIPLMMLLV